MFGLENGKAALFSVNRSLPNKVPNTSGGVLPLPEPEWREGRGKEVRFWSEALVRGGAAGTLD